ncbi:hypothetical protein JW916_00635 [Candidatus Sumerlaeota bacterium]|nr:hypothetical protein [Candidatus Sumerlaeota bacterium]
MMNNDESSHTSSDKTHASASAREDRETRPRGRAFTIVFLALWGASLAGFCVLAAIAPGAIRRHFARMPTGVVYRCNQAMAAGDYAAVEREARPALDENLSNFDLRFLLVESLLRRGRAEEGYRELAAMETFSRDTKSRSLVMHGFDLGKLFYRMARIDLSQGRLEQAVGHLSRTIDEAPDYIDQAPSGEISLRDFVHEQLGDRDLAIDKMIAFCRVLCALNEEPAARALLERIHASRPEMLTPLLVEAEIDLYGMAQTYTREGLNDRIESARDRIDAVLSSPNADWAARLWGTLLRGGEIRRETRPVEAISDEALDSLLGDRAVLALKPPDFQSVEGRAHISPLRINLFRNGTVRSEFELATPASSLWILARGSCAMGLWPYAVVRLDGTEAARVYVRLNAYRPYVLPVSAEAGKHVLEIEFTNDEFESMWKTDSNLNVRAAVWMP